MHLFSPFSHTGNSVPNLSKVSSLVFSKEKQTNCSSYQQNAPVIINIYTKSHRVNGGDSKTLFLNIFIRNCLFTTNIFDGIMMFSILVH